MTDPDIEIKRKKEQAQNDTNKYLQMENEVLLEDMVYVSSKPPERDLPKNATDEIIVRFSALLINLSSQADKSTQRIIKLTNQLRFLTWVLVILTITLIALELAKNLSVF